MIFLALSCLQTYRGSQALKELLKLAPDGIQLTPGCLPDINEEDIASCPPLRTHHGYSNYKLRERVWEDGKLLCHWHSVHPPTDSFEIFWKRSEFYSDYEFLPIALETMYPGYAIGLAEDLNRAMDLKLNLAVDIAHLSIMTAHHILIPPRLFDYSKITEIHVSQSKGHLDTHAPISAKTPYLDWAKERGKDKTPLILESYMHRVNQEQRQAQVDLLRS